MCPEFSHRFPRLDEKRFIILQFAQRSDNRVEGFPASRSAARSAINNKAFGIFGDVGIEIVHKHPQGRFLVPAFAGSLIAAWRVDYSLSAHNGSSPLSKSPRLIPSA